MHFSITGLVLASFISLLIFTVLRQRRARSQRIQAITRELERLEPPKRSTISRQDTIRIRATRVNDRVTFKPIPTEDCQTTNMDTQEPSGSSVA